MAVSVKSLLHRILHQHDDWRMQLMVQWPSIMGELHDKVSVEKISHETLFLGAHDSCWLTELYMLSTLIINNVNEALGQPRIKQIRLRLKPLQKLVMQVTTCSDTRAAPYSFILSSREKQALEHIKDQDLQNALEQFLKRCKYEQRQ